MLRIPHRLDNWLTDDGEVVSFTRWPRFTTTTAADAAAAATTTTPYGRIFGFLDRSRNFFFQVAPQLYSRG
jgi:hypothetical protein